MQTVTCAPGEQGVAQVGERSRIREGELLGPARDREVCRLAGEPDAHLRARRDRGGGHGDALGERSGASAPQVILTRSRFTAPGYDSGVFELDVDLPERLRPSPG